MFDQATDEYDRGRPDYPAEVYDALGPIEGSVILEGGAGTGVASRALLSRGARVVPFDTGWKMLSRAVAHSPELPGVLADGAYLPFRSHCADLVCYAQSWHWLDSDRRCEETARVLFPGGRWAGWWSQPRADDDEWFAAYWTAIESACTGTNRSTRDTDWGQELERSQLFIVDNRVTAPWTRSCTVERWLTDQRSHSYVVGLPDSDREQLMGDLGTIVRNHFPGGLMEVPNETWLWIAHLI